MEVYYVDVDVDVDVALVAGCSVVEVGRCLLFVVGVVVDVADVCLV